MEVRTALVDCNVYSLSSWKMAWASNFFSCLGVFLPIKAGKTSTNSGKRQRHRPSGTSSDPAKRRPGFQPFLGHSAVALDERSGLRSLDHGIPPVPRCHAIQRPWMRAAASRCASDASAFVPGQSIAVDGGSVVLKCEFGVRMPTAASLRWRWPRCSARARCR